MPIQTPLEFPCVFCVEESGGISTYFPHFNNASTCGNTVTEAVEFSEDLLRELVKDLLFLKKQVPMPTYDSEWAQTQVRNERDASQVPKPKEMFCVLVRCPLDFDPAQNGQKVTLTLRLKSGDLDEIDRKARMLGMPRSGFLLRAARAFQLHSASPRRK